jgi:hypothetical protein
MCRAGAKRHRTAEETESTSDRTKAGSSAIAARDFDVVLRGRCGLDSRRLYSVQVRSGVAPGRKHRIQD